MLAVCDGGSTKADWKISTEKGEPVEITTTGFNPNYHTAEQITSIVQQELAPYLDTSVVDEVFYYGAGCWDAGPREVVSKALRQFFTQAKIEVSHDLLAAARATCGNDAGIVCILGTGSNSMLYDGRQETDHVTNLGFLLGDEGSGSQIGKKIVQAYFYREMPEDLQPIMLKACPNGRQDIMKSVYHGKGAPAAYLATYVSLFAGHFRHPFVKQIIGECFMEFLTRHVCKYENHLSLPVHFVGSVAYHCSDILKEALQNLGLHLGQVLHKPALNLFNFHLSTKKNQARTS